MMACFLTVWYALNSSLQEFTTMYEIPQSLSVILFTVPQQVPHCSDGKGDGHWMDFKIGSAQGRAGRPSGSNELKFEFPALNKVTYITTTNTTRIGEWQFTAPYVPVHLIFCVQMIRRCWNSPLSGPDSVHHWKSACGYSPLRYSSVPSPGSTEDDPGTGQSILRIYLPLTYWHSFF